MVHERLPLDPELLVAQIGWVRSLARSLVRDPAIAEDLEQEAYLAALQAPPPEGTDAQRLRAWLSKVVRNLSRLRLRGNARRSAREFDAARSESVDSVSETVERAAVLRVLVDAVMELDEPNRSCVLLRYFEGLSTAEIAVETGASTVAVRKRLSRGLQQLRRRLDAQFDGDRQAWFAALAPLVAPLPVPSPAAPAAPTPSPTLLSGAGLAPVLVVCAALGALALHRLAAAEPAALPWPAVADARPGADGDALLAALDGGRSALGAGGAAVDAGARADGAEAPLDRRRGETRPQPPAAEPAADAVVLRGRVLALSGAPLAGLDVVGLPAEAGRAPRAASGGDGAFALELAAGQEQPARLAVLEGEFTTVRAARVEAARGVEHVVVAARAIAVGGRVLDAAGRPLPGARVERVIPGALLADVPAPLHRTLPVPATARADAAGRYAITGVLAPPGARLRASLEGYAPAVLPMPAGPVQHLDFVLRPAAAPAHRLAGIVRHADGSPAAGADVRLGRHGTSTDANGEFVLELDALDPGAALVVTKPGFHASWLPGVAEGLLDGGDAGPGSSPALVLVLGGPTFTIAGQVVDAEGEPGSGWLVFASLVGDGSPAAELAGATHATGITGLDGHFHIEDVEAGSYELRAFDPVTHALAPGGVVAAGETAVSLRAPLDPEGEALRGRLVDGEGTPLAGAQLVPVLPFGGPAGWPLPGPPLVVGPDGTWDLGAPLPPGSAVLVEHPGVLDPLWSLPEELAGAVFHDLRVDTERAFQLRGWDERVNAVRVLDAEGQPLTLHGPETAEPCAAVQRGRSTVLAVSERARTAVLLRGDEELARVPLLLAPEGLTVLEP